MNNSNAGIGKEKATQTNEFLSARSRERVSLHWSRRDARTSDSEKLLLEGKATTFRSRIGLQPQGTNCPDDRNSLCFHYRVMANQATGATPTRRATFTA